MFGWIECHMIGGGQECHPCFPHPRAVVRSVPRCLVSGTMGNISNRKYGFYRQQGIPRNTRVWLWLIVPQISSGINRQSDLNMLLRAFRSAADWPQQPATFRLDFGPSFQIRRSLHSVATVVRDSEHYIFETNKKFRYIL